MKINATLVIGDFKNIARDKMMMFITVLPLLLGLLMRYLVPFIAGLLIQHFSFDLTDYYPLIASIFAIMSPMMFGWVTGFIMLDERDENILSYVSITPLSKTGYMSFKISVSVILSFVLALAVIPIMNLTQFSYIKYIPIALMAALEAPIFALLLVSLANNKVEGMAIAKLLGLVDLAPVAAFLMKSDWQLLLGIIPPYWVARAIKASYTPGPDYWLSLSAGFVIHIALTLLLLRRFNQKVN